MIEALAFAAGMGVSVLIMAWFFRETGVGLPTNPRPYGIFRLVKRSERVTYVAIMRRTMAVQMRDMDRAIRKAAREIGKALLPIIEKAAASLQAILGKS